MSESLSRTLSKLPPFFRRAVQLDQMEFDSALSQMYSLIVKPSVVSKMSKARNMTKNHYFRDDPAFLVLQILFFVFEVSAYYFALGSGMLGLFYSVSVQILVYYALFGVVAATILLALLNKYFMREPLVGEVRREVEWRYCFDLHCNGYFVYFVWTKLFPYILLPALLRKGFVARVVSNTFYLIGLSSYVYVIFLGCLELPMVAYQQKLMYPIPVLVFLILLITLLSGWNLVATDASWFSPAKSVMKSV